jgi:hypothetical protein
MPAKLKRHVHRHSAAATAPLPPARTLEQPFVLWPATGRLIAPWPRGPLTWEMERVLLAVLARVRAAPIDTPCWIWADRDPEPVKTEGDLAGWLTRWSADRAAYVARR